jgi:arylsulfatase
MRPLVFITASILCAGMGRAQTIQGVPIPEEQGFKGVIGDTDKQSKPDYPKPVAAPPGSPNVVYIVLDDVGFADLGAYGSEIHTPNIDRLAKEGLLYTNFHTRAICSPTRASLLTGRNSHAVGLRTVANSLNGFPNGRGRVTHAAATLAEMLQSNGYDTFAVGKWHLVPGPEAGPAGPVDQWPVQRGFDRFYGFLDALADQYHPELVRDNTEIDPPARHGYHLSVDLVDQSIRYLRNQNVQAMDKPFFLYLAFGAAHAPHQVPASYIDKYVPVFEKGWDKTRDERLARQKQLGIAPRDTELTPRNPGIKSWDSLTADEKRLFVRFQAAYAGFVEHTDEQVGRLIDYLRDSGKLDNSIVVLISDNGANPEGGFEGTTNALSAYMNAATTLEHDLSEIDRIGTERSFSNYPRGWAMAGNTPFRLYKEYVDAGGVNDPLIIHWPKGIRSQGQVRRQFVDVIDITPTILSIVGIPAPTIYRGVPQLPLHGASVRASFDDPDAANARHTQYFELHGHRAIWHDGWRAVTLHEPGKDFSEDQWRLYHTAEDFAENNDLAQSDPERLRQLTDLWWAQAREYGVLPLDGRSPLDSIRTELPRQILSRPLKYTYYPGIQHVPHEASPMLSICGYTITAQVDRGDTRAEGVLFAYGGAASGVVFYIRGNKLAVEHNTFGTHNTLVSQTELPAGRAVLRYEFSPTGSTSGSGTLFLNDRQIAAATYKLPSTLFYTWEGIDIGRDGLSHVSEAYADKGDFEFPEGAIRKVELEIRLPASFPASQAGATAGGSSGSR